MKPQERRALRSVVLAACVLTLVAAPALADSFYFSPDVPVQLGAMTYQPWNVVRDEAGAYTIPFSLPAGLELDGVYHGESGEWLYSFKSTAMLSGSTFQAEDVVHYGTSTGYTLLFDGSTYIGPNSWNVDAVFRDASGDLVLSFDVPTTFGMVTYDPADLVRFNAGVFSLAFDASAAGIPSSTNVTGADLNGPLTVMTFDTPTSVGGTTYLPGELVAWDGIGLSSYRFNPGWPIAIRINALSFLADPGRVDTITLTKSPIAAGAVIIEWTPSCSAGAEDYAIYEGQAGNWTSHAPIDCFDDGHDNSELIFPGTGNHYYLVVPRNADYEGSYGMNGNVERPPALNACLTPQRTGTCP